MHVFEREREEREFKRTKSRRVAIVSDMPAISDIRYGPEY